ncbi:MAG: NAD-dependent epimerase/dehydratase family protein, partial [Deltaproteobacteria bacterium]|nr:NAD-dependent epimerase/dehydratase family protein [Deltaproteobacteria bacterium]
MSKNVLVIGGSYFVGRVFMLMAAAGRFTGDFTFHLLNRGRYSLKLPGVTEHVCNRHDPERLARLLPALDWEAVIDFCAYSPGDIQTLLEALPGTLRQFIYISTCSVYEPHTPSPKKESSPKLERGGDDPGLAYAYNKLLLEKEAFRSCAVKDAALTILRPSFIYGPFNYAPREPYYFELILHKKPIPAPTDATGRVNFVYVKDSAR